MAAAIHAEHALAAVEDARGEDQLQDALFDDDPERATALVRTVGDPPAFDFEPKQHFELGEALGLMDGGIYDNQGVGSILWSDRRHLSREEEEAGQHYYDLMIISDVTSSYMDDFKFHPVSEEKKGWRSWNYQLLKKTAGRLNPGR